MHSYALYIHDTRYSVPTLVFVTEASEGRARARATEFLLQSPHHLSVEVMLDGKSVCTVAPERRQAPQKSVATPFVARPAHP